MAWIAALDRRARGDEIPLDWIPWVPETQYWVVLGEEVVGDLALRHPLNDQLRQLGGNVGFSTHPGYRGKGIATFALREALKILASAGLSEALATCRHDNVASIRVIEKCAGIRVDDARLDSFAGCHIAPRRRYVIPTIST